MRFLDLPMPPAGLQVQVLVWHDDPAMCTQQHANQTGAAGVTDIEIVVSKLTQYNLCRVCLQPYRPDGQHTVSCLNGDGTSGVTI